MNSRTLLLGAVLLSGAIFPLAPPATAIRGGELTGLKVIGYHWTSRIASENTATTVDHPDAARFLILKLAANLKSEDVIFGDDFVLVYRHPDGSEDRAACRAMGHADTAEPGEFGAFYLGPSPRLAADPGPVYFGLSFVIEHDVESVEVHPIGGSPIAHRIGSGRPYSVYLSTNQPEEVLPRVRRVAEAAGLQVTGATTALDPEHKGAVVFYAPAAEDAARDLAARLQAELGTAVDVQPLELIADIDLVLWLGLP
jgi:hypothetical protein